MDQELVQYLDERFGGIDRRFEQVDRQFAEMRQEVNARSEEVKRHFGVLTEDLRRQLQLVAEGFATFVEGRYTQDQARIDERFHETHALIRSSYDHLNRQDDQLRLRIENLERKGQG